jgi:hypothetical protein
MLLVILGDGTDIFRHRLAVAWGGAVELDGRGSELAAQVLQLPQPGGSHGEPAPPAEARSRTA